MVEFMNFYQGRMSVQEYSLKFTQLSKYAPTMVVDPRARMNKFVMEVSSLVEKECRMTMLLNDMDISRLMVYVQQIEESKIREIRQDVRGLGRMILVTKSLRKGSITKIIPWETRIGLQIKVPKVVVVLLKGIGALIVVRNIWVSVLPEQMVVFHVEIRPII